MNRERISEPHMASTYPPNLANGLDAHFRPPELLPLNINEIATSVRESDDDEACWELWSEGIYVRIEKRAP